MATASVQNGTVTIYQPNSVPQFSPRDESWLLWKERLEIHMVDINCTEENAKKSTLLKAIGPIPYETLHNLCSPASPVSKTYKELCELLKTHYTPPTIVFRERKNFHSATQSTDESVSEWHARVKKLALSCKFGENLAAFVLDRFIMGINNNIFERLCEEDERITIDEALRKSLIMEMKCLTRNDGDMQIGYVNNKKNYNNRGYQNQNKNYNNDYKQKNQPDENKTTYNKPTRSNNACVHCGWRNHLSRDCRYKESKCHYCKKIGHLQTVCNKKEKVVNYLSESDSNSENLDKNNPNDFSIYSISHNNGVDSTKLYSVSIKINGFPVNVICDSGAPCSLVSKSFFEKYGKNVSLNACQDPFVDYNGNRINILGEYYEEVELNEIRKEIKLVVTNSNNSPLFGRNFLRKFNFELVQVNMINSTDQSSIIIEQIKNEFSEVFDSGLGSYKFGEISLVMDDDVKPIFFKPRPIPFAWKEKIENNLRDLIAKDVLEPVDHSEWGTPLVPVLKPNGDIRICGDYKVTINKYLSDFKYPLPLIDEIFASLEGGEVYTKLDLSNAYNQLILDEKSQMICTWSTPIGTLKMKRLPFGVKPAASIFQKTIENLLRGIPFVVAYQDDITISGKNMHQHIQNLKTVLTKLCQAGLKLNLKKCEFFKKNISYLGFTIDRFGLRKNKDRTESVLKAPVPENISELRAFIGMVNYYAKFIDNYARIMIPLYKLLQKDVKYEWSKDCQIAYDTIKGEVTSDKVLVHFNPKLPIVLTTDASDYAIAGILSHNFPNNELKPVSFVSRALTKAERKYSTHEKEALAIIFCVTKLRQYLIGHFFTLKTDHKPLLSIFGENKGLPIMAAARVQRWAFILSGFNYKIEHVKGHANYADNFSRMPQVKAKDEINNIDDNSYVNLVEKENILNLDFTDIARETRRDPVLSKVCEFVKMGKIKDLQGEVFAAYTAKDIELTVDRDCLLWGYRVVVPKKLRKAVLDLLHESHLGIVKTKSVARSYIWWPKLDKDIEYLIKSCLSCQQLLPSPERSKLIPWVPTNSVWQRIHIDFAGPVNNFYFFIIIDSYSKWVEVFKTKNITSNFVITKLREVFSRFGIVHTIVSDNGRQFVSDEFKCFVQKNKIKHVLTAPGHPATNGQAENFVKVLKKSIYANLDSTEGQNIDVVLSRFLMDYRNMKHCTTGESPAFIFLGRSIRTRFDLIKPPIIRDVILEKQEKSISDYKGKRIVDFEEGQNVLIRDYSNPNKNSWAPAVIKTKIGPRSYTCLLRNGRLIKRHTDQIKPATVYMSNENIMQDIPLYSNEDTVSLQVEQTQENNTLNEIEPPVDKQVINNNNEECENVSNENVLNEGQRNNSENEYVRKLRPRIRR